MSTLSSASARAAASGSSGSESSRENPPIAAAVVGGAGRSRAAGSSSGGALVSAGAPPAGSREGGEPRRQDAAVDAVDQLADAPLGADVGGEVEREHEADLVEEPQVHRVRRDERELAPVERERREAVPLGDAGGEDAARPRVAGPPGGRRRRRQLRRAPEVLGQPILGERAELEQRGVERASGLALALERALDEIGGHRSFLDEERCEDPSALVGSRAPQPEGQGALTTQVRARKSWSARPVRVKSASRKPRPRSAADRSASAERTVLRRGRGRRAVRPDHPDAQEPLPERRPAERVGQRRVDRERERDGGRDGERDHPLAGERDRGARRCPPAGRRAAPPRGRTFRASATPAATNGTPSNAHAATRRHVSARTTRTSSASTSGSGRGSRSGSAGSRSGSPVTVCGRRARSGEDRRLRRDRGPARGPSASARARRAPRSARPPARAPARGRMAPGQAAGPRGAAGERRRPR